jgi:hypothetical protein
MPVKDADIQIDTMPTKRFFVDMFVRDIPLEQAVLDLLDNCIDGVKRVQENKKENFEGFKVEIKFNSKEFRITDNCGGFDRKTARQYAFRFGREKDQEATAHSIGQFGVGMKRALFKFGNCFVVRSATKEDEWAIDINVPEWEESDDWHFPWDKFHSDKISKKKPGTEIIVSDLRPEVAQRFGTDQFQTLIVRLIKSKHRQFIAEGLSVSVNGHHLNATSIYLLVKDSTLRPGVESITYTKPGEKPVRVRIVVAIAPSQPREAGWYVICNGRVVLEADRRDATGWGALEDGSGKLVIPAFHNQFARFRGIVTFDSEDSSRVPWNTTKNDIDQDNAIWQKTLRRMIEMMRPVMDFLNELDDDVEEHGKKHSPMLDVVEKASPQSAENFVTKSTFRAPNRAALGKSSKTVKIQYSKPTKEVEFLQDALNLSSAAAVGEKTFQIVYDRQKR